MRILIAAFGSRGDVQPMLALALGLRDAGHVVTFAAPPNFAAWIRSFDLRFEPVGSDVEKAIEEIGLNVLKGMRAMRNEVHQQFDEIAPLARGADVLIGASIHCASVSFGEAQGIPAFYAFFSPLIAPSRHHAPPFVSLHGLPRWANALVWSGMRLTWRALIGAELNEERRKLGLAPLRETWEHILGHNPLFAGEPALAPLPPDARADIVTTGAWLLPETGPLDPELEAFLSGGPPPVYIGFGSMPDPKPERTTRILLDAIREAGVRAVISSGWARLGLKELPDSVRVIGPAPHSMLFPRCAAIVHHGGAGTTMAAANAGVPQVIVPHAFDQFHCSRLIPALGVAPPSIPKAKLTSARLASAIRACLDNATMQSKARQLATRTVRDGVARAVTHIERVAAAKKRAVA